MMVFCEWVQRWYDKPLYECPILHTGSWFVWIRSVECCNQGGRVCDIFGDFPSRRFGSVFVPLPLDKVFRSIAMSPRVEDCCGFVFGVVVNLDRHGWGLCAIQDCVCLMGFKKR